MNHLTSVVNPILCQLLKLPVQWTDCVASSKEKKNNREDFPFLIAKLMYLKPAYFLLNAKIKTQLGPDWFKQP